MNISYNWLKEYIDFDLTPEELKEKLTFSGIEVENVIYTGEELKQIKVAKILEKEKHPNAEKLNVCKVYDGENEFQVVCGAPNCAQGQTIAFAPIGTSFGDFKIKKAKLRGVESYGMICSEKELGLSDDHSGIMVLPENATLGQNLADFLNVSDVVYEVEITPNRPDLLGIIGVARDLSALLNLDLKLPQKESFIEEEQHITKYLILENQCPDICSRYMARVIKNVQVKESPEWLKNRLISVGLRPINNIVDVTNFVMMEFGHPLHAFDYNKLEGNRIIVRKACPTEKFIALDGHEYQLEKDDIVIADQRKPVAIAGVIGGSNSEIDYETTDIVLETANFLYSSVRKTSNRLKIFTDSAYRFERGMSDETISLISDRAVSLIMEVAGGELCKGVLDNYLSTEKNATITLRPTKVREFLHIDIDNEKIIEYLESLGLKLIESNQKEFLFSVPTFRKDLTREIDLIEEIIRLHGYNNVPEKMITQSIMDRPSFYKKRTIEDTLIRNGFFQTVNWPFADPEDLDKLKIPENSKLRKFVKIKNPIGTRYSIMQTTILPNLLKNVFFNLNHGQSDIRLFEMTKTYFDKGEKLAEENLSLCFVMLGNAEDVRWDSKERKIDFYDAKGVVEDILESIGIKDFTFREYKENFYFQPGLGAEIIRNEEQIGLIGKLDPKIAQSFDIENEIYTVSLDVEKLLNSPTKEIVFNEIPRFPISKRDLSFVVSIKHSYDEILNVIKQADKNLISDVKVFDEYKGKGIKSGMRSISVSLSINSMTKTLTDKQVNKVVDKVINSLKNKFNIEMR